MNIKKMKTVKWIVGGIGLLLILTLILASISFVVSYDNQLAASAQSKAEYLIDRTSVEIEEKINDTLTEARSINEEVSALSTESEICTYLYGLTSVNSSLKTVRMFRGGQLYSALNVLYQFDSSQLLESIRDVRSISFVGIYFDGENTMNLACVYIPYANGSVYDGIVLYYEPKIFGEIELDYDSELASYLALTKKTTTAINVIKANEALVPTDNIRDSVLGKVYDTAETASVSALFNYEGQSVAVIHIMSERYYLLSSKVGESSNIYLIGLYKSADVYAAEYSFYRAVTGMLIIFASVVVVFFVVQIIRYLYSRHYSKDEATSSAYRCLTYIGFANEAAEIYKDSQGSKFAVVCAQIRFFKYILSLGEGLEKRIVFSIRGLLNKMMETREIFGYDQNGVFYLFLHYDTIDDLINRLKRLDAVCKRIRIDDEKRLTFLYGIGKTEKNEDILTTIEHAKDALHTTEQNIGLFNYNIYDKEAFADGLDREFIEMNVERALSKGDFKVFYQPKYNMKKNMIDGAEALVRWYMPEENRFYPPAAFLPVIEQNGFIAKVDRYVFEQVCMYIRNSLNQGIRLQPISVNVSQVSMQLDDFVEFYTTVKEKYKIRDGMLYIEFTESTYFENTAQFIEMIDKLHKKGFLCSIDDFGTGFSSYNSLKQFNMDEIKLDRFFLKKGLSTERDTLVLKSVIELGKSLGMKVTTEGVSTTEEYNLLKSLQCDVIQGFLYAKPMSQADFESFVTGGAKGSFN